MQVLNVEQGTEEWLEARLGKITGTKLKDVVDLTLPLKDDIIKALDECDLEYKKSWTSQTLLDLLPEHKQRELMEKKPKKIGFYEILAEKIAHQPNPDDPKPIDRGTQLEPEAREKVALHLDEKVEEVGFCRSDVHPDIAVSPDGIIKKKGKVVYAVEIKCLSTARHLQALIEQRIPEDYKYQVLQYFIVMEDLEVLYFSFYDPRVVGHELVVLEVHRDEVADDVEKHLNYQKQVLEEIDRLAEKYSNF